jgi:hypothetical protein
MTANKTERVYGVINKWKEQCTNYQNMKENCIKLLEHPEATEEQLLEVARVLRDTRKRMADMKDYLNSTYPAYAFDVTGKVLSKAKPFLFDVKKTKSGFVAPRSLSIAIKKSTTN